MTAVSASWKSRWTCSRWSAPGPSEGRYHVLHGAISPVDGIGPERLHISELLTRVEERHASGQSFEEIVIATNPTLEGEATAMYLAERIGGRVGAISRIARGIPVGGDLEYADEVTLGPRPPGPTPAHRGWRPMMYLVNEALLRLIKPAIALVLGLVLYWILTSLLGEPGGWLLGLLCWVSAGTFIHLVETGVI